MKKISLLFLLLCSILSFSQNTNNIWYFGDGNFLDFNANMATPVLSGQGVEVATPISTYCQEGASTICDAAGNLLFYNNSENVWDRNFNPMPNGTGLIGSASTSAQTLIVPKPGSATIYYIFHMDYAAAAVNNGLYYTEVDISLNAGLGSVTANKNVLLNGGACSEQLKAVTHCNGTDIWVISHSVIGNTFKCHLVSSTGVNIMPITTSIGSNHPTAFSGMSYMTCSKNGSQIALAGNMGGTPSVEVFNFDNLNGTFCNPQYLPTPDFASSYGVEFSADGTKLYTTGFQLHQYDFNTTNWYTYAPTEIGAALMRGPNDKIYLVAGCDYYDAGISTMYYARDIHVIAAPNAVGTGANLQMNAYLTPRECGLGLSTCYYPTQTINTCSPLSALMTVTGTTICEGDCIDFSDVSSGAAITSYQWTFPGGVPATFNGSTPPTVCYAAQGTYSASLQITDCGGLTSTYNQDIIVLDCTQPQSNFQANLTQICVNNCLSYTDLSTGTNIAAWNWSFPGGAPNFSNAQNPTNICYNTPGTYDATLTVTGDFGTNTITIPNYIVVDPCIPPIADFTTPDTVCLGDCITIADASSNTPTQWNWVLNGTSTGMSTVQNPQNICFNTVGVFSLELTASNAYGSDVFSKNITVLAKPDAGADVSIVWCVTESPQDLSLILGQGIPLNGTWLNPQNTPAFAGTTFSPQLDNAGSYTIQYVLTNFICSDTMEFQIVTEGVPYAGLDGTLTICDNDSPVDLMAVIQGNPDLNGVWSPPLSSGSSFLDPSIDADGVYTYMVPQTIACQSDSSYATVSITYVFNVVITPVENLCTSSGEIVLEPSISNGTWSGAGISNNILGTFDPSIAGAGTHIVVYTIEIDDCEASTSTDIIITEMPDPDLGGDISNCVSELLTLEVDANPDDIVSWSNGSTGTITTVNLDNYYAGDVLTVEVQVENSCGISSDAIVVQLIDCNVYVYVPNSFSPDGDEYNNTFLPVLTGENINDFELTIFNRWGQRVFQSFDLNRGWDGTFSGSLVQSGVYVWTLVYTNSANAEADRTALNGHVSVLR